MKLRVMTEDGWIQPTVLVRHISDGRGNLLLSKREVVQTIVAEYEDGQIQTSSGDVWMVKKCNNDKADYMTDALVGEEPLTGLDALVDFARFLQ